MTAPRPDVVIVGAGPAGAALALLLARRGVRVTIVDRAHFPRDKPCGEAFGPGVRSFFARHRIALPARSTPIAGIRLAAGGTAVTLPYSGGALGFGACRRDLDGALAAAAVAAGARLLDGVVWRPVDPPAELRAPLVIGAGGLGCPVARRLGGRRQRGRVAFLAHLDRVAGLIGHGEAHLVGRGFVGVAPLGGSRANIAAVYDLEDFTDRSRFPDRAPERLWQAAVDAAGLAPRLAGARREGPIRATGPLGFRPGRLTAAGVLIAGDAAGFVDPFTGDGVSMALSSAELALPVVLDALAGPGPSAAALRPYAHAHRRALAPRLRFDCLLRAGSRSPWLARRLVAALARRPEIGERLLAVPADLAPPGSLLAPSLLLPLVATLLAPSGARA